MTEKSHSKKRWIECGRVGRPWGVKGQVSIFWNSGMCPVEVGRGRIYTRDTGGGYIPHLVLSDRPKGKRWIVALKGIENPEDAAKLRHENLYIPADELPPTEPGEFYCHEIIDLEVETETGELIGKVVNVLSTGGNDVYEIKPASGKKETILIPAIDTVVIKIDLQKKRMVIKPMEGMLD